jgi:hypothetical protein
MPPGLETAALHEGIGRKAEELVSSRGHGLSLQKFAGAAAPSLKRGKVPADVSGESKKVPLGGT